MRVNSARTQDTNNLKQIGLAAHGFHDAYKKWPYNGTHEVYESKTGKRGGNAHPGIAGSGSYAYQLLPFVEQQALWQGQTGTGSGPLAPLGVLLSPGRARPGVATVGYQGPQTDYHINPYVNRPNLLNGNTGDADACNREDEGRKIVDMKGGLFLMADCTARYFPYGTNLAPFLDPDDGALVTLPN